MTAVYEYERRSNCLQTEGTLEGLRWCESDIYPREFRFSYKELFILGLSWPLHLISSENNSFATLYNVLKPGKEEMPPVGENLVLNEPQVRWCFFEHVRLEMMESWTMTDQERAELKEAAVIKEYAARAGVTKKYVARYDERCTNLWSQQGTLGAISRELLFEGKRLQSEGVQRLYSSQSSLKDTVK
jgi:hypothetical protein